MKKNFLFLLTLVVFSLQLAPLSAQPEQSESELAALKLMAEGNFVSWRDALAATPQDSLPAAYQFYPAQDTVLAQYIIYADTAGLVRYVEDVWVIRSRNDYQFRQRPLSVKCLRVIMARYY